MINHRKLPEGHWGIFSKQDEIPSERWDPFCSISDKNGKILGHRCLISPLRASKPITYQSAEEIRIQSINLTQIEDPFCEIAQGNEPAIIIAIDDKTFDPPYSINPKQRIIDGLTATVINRYAPMMRVFLKEAGERKSAPLVHFPVQHATNIEDITPLSLEYLLTNIITSQKIVIDSVKEMHSKHSDISIMHFWNIGPRAGASIPHIHAQSYIMPVNGRGWRVTRFSQAAEFHRELYRDEDYCFACEICSHNEISDPLGQNSLVFERTVLENEHWKCFMAYAPEGNGQIRIFPKRHVLNFHHLTQGEIRSLVNALIPTNNALSKFISEKKSKSNLYHDRNIILRQKTYTDDIDFHIFLDIIPAQTIGGAEILDNVRICDTVPEVAAKKIRNILERL